ncbi:MFS-type transporter SLC18B1-like isoform X1 [Watersipora subatra]|uniref:MFS-type transporter SLC18B1-like isoform X1 n=1 Tax=Watersipora subatra TaxID=2589382 RepID=UPI00355BE972
MTESNEDDETDLLSAKDLDMKNSLPDTSSKKKYGMLLFLMFLQCLSRGSDTLLYPFYPEVARAEGVIMAYIGIVYSAYDLARFIFSPFFGTILTRWPPKSMCMVGTLISGCNLILFGYVGVISSGWYFLALCTILRVFAGVGSAMVTISTTSILLKASGFQSTNVIAIVEVGTGMAFAFGTALGGTLYEFVGYTATFWVSGGALVISTLFVAVFIPAVVEGEKKSQQGLFRLLTIPGCVLLCWTYVLARMQTTSRTIGLAELYIEELRSNPAVLGLLYAIWSAFYIGSCAVATRLLNKFPRSNYLALVISWIWSGVAVLLICPSPLLDFIFHGKKYFWLTTIDTVFVFIPTSIIYITPFQAALNLAEVNGYKRDSLHTYGMVAGLVNGAMSLGSTIGPVISGVIIESTGFGWTTTYLAFANFILALFIGCYSIYMRVTGQPTEVVEYQDNEEVTEEAVYNTEKVDNVREVNEKIIEKYLKHEDLTKVYLQQPASDSSNK